MLVSLLSLITAETQLRVISIITEQDLHRPKASFTCCAAILARRLGRCRKRRGDTARRGDSNRPKQYSRPYTEYIKWGGIWSDGICLPKSLLYVMESCSPGGGRTPVLLWEAES